MRRYLFASHDGYGLGHVRRNVLIAREVLRVDRSAQITLLTGVPQRPDWLADPRFTVVPVPPLLQNAWGVYDNPALGLHAAAAERGRVFTRTVHALRPDVVVVDRHPYGVAGELRAGLAIARRQGALLLVGLRDVLDDPDTVRREIEGRGWDGVPALFHGLIVFGDRAVCDHERAYGLPLRPTYCGWVVEQPPPQTRTPELVVIGAGGNGDGLAAFRLGVQALRPRPHLRGIVMAGPYAADWALETMHGDAGLAARVDLRRDTGSNVALCAQAGAVLQMASYNGTVEALATGLRPILVPRRGPRQEQAIRADRLAALGLADLVEEGAPAAEVGRLLDEPRMLAASACERSGIRLDGATFAAALLTSGASVV